MAFFIFFLIILRIVIYKVLRQCQINKHYVSHLSFSCASEFLDFGAEMGNAEHSPLLPKKERKHDNLKSILGLVLILAVTGKQFPDKKVLNVPFQ